MVGADHVAKIVLVAVRAGDIKLANPLIVQFLALGVPFGRWTVGLDRDGHAAGLQADIGGHRQHLLAFPLPRLGLHMLLAGPVDVVLESHECLLALMPLRHHGAKALHAFGRVAMTIRAGFSGGAIDLFPQIFAILREDHRRIFEIIRLQDLGFGIPKTPTRNDFVERRAFRRFQLGNEFLAIHNQFGVLIRDRVGNAQGQQPDRAKCDEPFHGLPPTELGCLRRP